MTSILGLFLFLLGCALVYAGVVFLTAPVAPPARSVIDLAELDAWRAGRGDLPPRSTGDDK